MNNQKIIFLLGNGFSQGFKFPSMSELWDECLKPSDGGQYQDFLNQAKTVFPLKYFCEKDIKNIELLLTVWKAYAEANRDFGDKNNFESGIGFYENYIKNFCAILHNNFKKNDLEIARLHQFMKELLERYNEVVFITTNYDLIIEKMVKQCNRQYHFFKSEKSIPIRKLHGSIAWFPFTQQHFNQQVNPPKLIFSNDRDYFVYDFSEFLLSDNTNVFSSIYTQFSSNISNADFAALIPPLIGKEYNELFSFYKELVLQDFKDFSKLIIIGYSFPEADPIIRDLIIRAYHHTRNNGQIFCVNDDLSICQKTKNLFGNTSNFKEINSKWKLDILKKMCLNEK